METTLEASIHENGAQNDLATNSATDIAYTPWNEWRAEEYLGEYYGEVMADERFAMEWLVDSMQKLGSVPVALDFGCGPTVHHLFPLVPKAAEFHLCDFLKGNLDEVRRWKDNADGAHDWLPFSLETLRLEGDDSPDENAARQREQMVRERITQIFEADAGQTDPLGVQKRASYPLVTSHYCAEGATNDKETWELFMFNIASLVAPGGTLILSACGAANFYRVGENTFPCAGVTTLDMVTCLEKLGFTDADVRVRQTPDHSEQGYGRVLFATARKGQASGQNQPSNAANGA